MSIRNELLIDILSAYGGEPVSGGRNDQLREILFTLSGLRLFNLTRNEYLELILKAIEDDSASLYVNPSFSGGDDNIAAGVTGVAPDSHGFAFNTVDFTNNRDGSITINSDNTLGRRNLTYDLAANNPNLEVGSTYRIEYVVGNSGGSNPLVLGTSSITDVNIVSSSGSVPVATVGVVYVEFIPTSPNYALTIRVGCGPTTTNDAKVTISKPKLIKAPSAGAIYIDFDTWVDTDEWSD